MLDRPTLADAFARWVLQPTHDDTVAVPAFRDGSGTWVDALPVATVAYELADFSDPLPDEVGAVLRLPASATYAHAARLLWCLREDEALHTPTYEATVQTLRSLPEDEYLRYYRVVDEAVDAVTTTLPVWPGSDEASPA